VADPLLQIDGLVKRFGGLTATNDVMLSVERGEVHALIGPNGAGKTTLIQLISGGLQADAGTIRLNGVNITGASMHARVHRGLARSYQITNIFRKLTVLDRRRVRCSTKSAWPTAPPFWRKAFRMVSSGSLKSQSRWRRGRICFCSTSRWRAWDRRSCTKWCSFCASSRAR
jgi:branched-chain amino acid transport system ATP-binding protein